MRIFEYVCTIYMYYTYKYLHLLKNVKKKKKTKEKIQKVNIWKVIYKATFYILWEAIKIADDNVGAARESKRWRIPMQ